MLGRGEQSLPLVAPILVALIICSVVVQSVKYNRNLLVIEKSQLAPGENNFMWLIEDLQAFKEQDPKNNGDPETDSQLEELIAISRLDDTNCNFDHESRMEQLKRKYYPLKNVIVPFIDHFIAQQRSLCTLLSRDLMKFALAEISDEQKSNVDQLRVLCNAPLDGHILEYSHAIMGIIQFITNKLDDSQLDTILTDPKKQDGPLYSDFFDQEITGLCNKIGEKLAYIATLDQVHSAFVQHWISNQNVCAYILLHSRIMKKSVYQRIDKIRVKRERFDGQQKAAAEGIKNKPGSSKASSDK